MSSVVETSDVGSTLALLSSTRGVSHLRAFGEPAGMRLAHDSIGPVSIDRLTFGLEFDAEVGPTDRVVLGQVNSGAVGFRADERADKAERWYAPGDIYLAGQPRRRRAAMVRAGQHEQAVFDPALFSQVADSAPGRAQQPIRFTGYQAVSFQAAQMWKNTYAFVRQVAFTDSDRMAQPLFAANVARLLVATALSTFPNNMLADPTAEDRQDSHPATLRRAVAFIDDHAHEDITLANVASAAHVTMRAIQLAFRRHLDTTPTEYLRRVRLGHAHHDLLAAGPADQVTVTAVSYRWGFASPSRFAAMYRQAYGVTPRDTLRA